MKTRIFTILLLFVLCGALSAQSAASEMETLLASETITWAQAARFVLQASEVLVTSNEEDAFWYAAIRKWLPTNAQPGDTARIDGIALLLMRSFNIHGGVMYTVLGNSHYAFRELVYRDIIHGRTDRYQMITGEQLVSFTGRILDKIENDEMAALLYADERLALEKRHELIPDSFDFGILFNQFAAGYLIKADDVNDDSESFFEYRANLTPRVSFILGDIGTFYISLGLSAGYDDSFYHVYELLRTEMFFRFGDLGFRVGRFNYSDPMKFVANSLFDGIQVTHTSHRGQFGIGTWFSGAVYKKNADIMMTAAEIEYYNEPIDRDDFFNTYFAPPRFLFAFDWEHPSIGGLVHLSTAATWQFDGTAVDMDQKFHTQYYTVRAAIPFNDFMFTAGGSIGNFISVLGDSIASATFIGFDRFSLAAGLGVNYTIPSKFHSMVSFNLNFGSGEALLFRFTKDASGLPFYAFVPVTTQYYGEIFKPTLTGYTIFKLEYSARFIEALGASVSGSYFIRHDVNASPGNLVMDGDVGFGESFMGAEINTQVVFSPFSDVRYILGVGAFMPALGNNWPDAKSIWRISIRTTFGLY